jgi:hypothetical protein
LSLTLNNVTFVNNSAAQAASLALTNVAFAFIAANFAFDKHLLPGAVSVGLRGNSVLVNFTRCCFSASDRADNDTTVVHINGSIVGTVGFALPICFDTTKEKSLYFQNGQDPANGMVIFECVNCAPPIATGTPWPASTPPQTAVASATPVATIPATAAADSGKISAGAIAGISVGAVAIVVIVVVVAVICVRKKPKYPAGVDSQLLSTEPLVSLETQGTPS